MDFNGFVTGVTDFFIYTVCEKNLNELLWWIFHFINKKNFNNLAYFSILRPILYGYLLFRLDMVEGWITDGKETCIKMTGRDRWVHEFTAHFNISSVIFLVLIRGHP